MADEATDVSNKEIKTFSCPPLCRLFKEYSRGVFSCTPLLRQETTGNAIKELITNSVRDLGLIMDNCGGQSYDGAGNMAGRYAGVLTLIQHQFPKFILLLDKFLLVETSHTNCWIHPCNNVESFTGHRHDRVQTCNRGQLFRPGFDRACGPIVD